MMIHRSLILVAVMAALTLPSVAVLSGMPESQADKNAGLIKAEVIGTLHFQQGRGYFISVKSSRNHGWENRVWLWISEEKLLIRQLEGLIEKKVIAKGELEQMPQNVQASVPPQGMYLRKVEIEEAQAK
jgi:hypothetical protein